MQTFLPHPDFWASARVLDWRRLGKQRVETLQLLKALAGETRGWSNHPAAKMWRGHERSLITYGAAICITWIGMGYRDTCLNKIRAFWGRFPGSSEDPPEWVGNEDFHLRHQSNLIRKDAAFYAPLFPGVPSDLEYLWP